MMQRSILGLLAAIAACACTSSRLPDADHQTHWLKLCSESSECGELQCVCGVCSSTCADDAAACAAGASCLAADHAAVRELCADQASMPAGVCLASCKRDADCVALGADLVCSNAACVPRQPAPSMHAEVELPSDSGPTRPTRPSDSGSAVGPVESADDDAGTGTVTPDFPATCALPPEYGTCNKSTYRYYHDAATRRCALFLYGGCGSNGNNFETLEDCESTCNVTPRSQPCSIEATDPSLPGVRLRIEGATCSVPIDTTQRFTYSVELDDAIAYTAPDTRGSCGFGTGSDDPLSLTSVTVVGGGLSYCECDFGCGPGSPSVAHMLPVGLVTGELDWPGRAWGGPSDTNVPLGDPFPNGSYAVHASFSIPDVGMITAELPIEVFTPN